MPTIPADAPRGNYKFYDQAVTLPHIFAAGAVLDDNLARFLNQQVATAVGNRFGAKVRRALDELNDTRAAAAKAGTYTGPTVDILNKKGEVTGTAPAPATVADLGWDAQAEIEVVFTDFEPGVSQRGASGSAGPTGDPVAQEMRRLAGVAVKDLYKAKGIKYQDAVKSVDAEGKSAYAKHVDAYLAAKGDQLRAIVEAQFAALKATESVVDELDFGAAA